MPRLIIDDRPIEVPDGTKVIAAAERLGIMIPRFCYHPALGSVGACRVCAVKFLDGPVKGIQMSCMLDIQEGMVVSTTDAEAVDFRRHVIEWLMLHHPHDCPVCDEGGHCLLQDMTVAGGHGLRRYLGPKRTYRDQDLGPLVQHEMNRCIHCYRCSRYYQEYSGYTDLGALAIGNRTYFGRFREGTLQSPFSGNLSDLCPTGVYTDKPSRYKGRRWDFERSPAICRHCGLGCHLTVSARYREIVRHEARHSAEVNGHFICDRGRFGFYYSEDPFRPRKACFGPREADLTEALTVGREGLRGVVAAHGPEAVALAAGMGCSLETLYAAQRLCQSSGWPAPSFFPQANTAERIKSAVQHLDEPLALSLGAVADADFILVVGGDPLNEAPMLAMALRQAQRKGACIGAIDPRPVALPFAFTHLPAHPAELDQCLGALFKASVDPVRCQLLDAVAKDFHRKLPDAGDCREAWRQPLEELTQRLRRARRPLIVCGSEIVSPATPALAAAGCRLLRAMDRAAHLFYMLPEANSFGAALLGGGDFEQTLAEIESGRVKALIVVEWDPLRDYPDGRRVAGALARLDLLIVLDHLATTVGDQAQILLPTATIYESGGLYLNHEGRLQQSWPAYRGGVSIAQTGGGGHPPRVYSNGIPGADPSPAWHLLAQLGPEPPQAAVPIFDALLPALGLPADSPIAAQGVRISAAAGAGPRLQAGVKPTPNQIPEGFALLTTAWTFGTEPLAALAPPLQQIEAPPCLAMHRADAAELGIGDHDRVTIQAAAGNLTLAVRLCDNMARGVLIVPRHHRLAWQVLDTAVNPISAHQISKTAGRR